MDDDRIDFLEMVERYGLGNVVEALAEACHEKADQLLVGDNNRASGRWFSDARILEECAQKLFN